MASTIKLKNGSGAPLASDLVQGEPALDLTNKRLYTEDSGGNVIEVGTNPTEITTADLTATTADINGGTIDGVTIGGSSAGAGTFTTGQFNTSLNVDGTVTCDGFLKDNQGSNFKIVDLGASSTEIAVESGGQLNITTEGANNIEIHTADTLRTTFSSTGGLTHQKFAIFNEEGGDNDFRVESDTNTHAMFVQGSDGAIGVGTGSPAVSGIEITRNTGSASPTPSELRLSTSTSASDWSTTDPWGRVSFYSADGSVGGAKVQASIQTIATATNGGASDLTFSVVDTVNGTLFKGLSLEPSGTNSVESVLYGGSGTERLRVGSSTAVFNDSGNDYDFRVESNNESNMFFIDASEDGIGIKTGSVSDATLTVFGSGALNDYNAIQIRSSNSANTAKGGFVSFAQYDDADTSYLGFAGFDNGSNRTLYIGGGGWGIEEATEVRLYAGAYDAGSSGAPIRFTCKSNESVFNDPSNDYDFRVESDNRTHAFFVDGATGCIGINNSGPTAGGLEDNAGSVKIDNGTITINGTVVNAGGTMDLKIADGGNGFAGFLVVTNTVTTNANFRTMVTYSVFGRGTDCVANSINSDTGSSGAAGVLISFPSTGVIRVTNNTGYNSCQLQATFFGALSA